MSPEPAFVPGDLFALTTPRAAAPGAFEFDVPDGWQQGRGAFGGLVVAFLARAVEAHAGAPERPLRALDAQLAGATVVGPATVTVETLRAGSGVSTIAARLVQQGELRAHAVAVLGRARGGEPAVVGLEPPRPTPWRDVPVLPLHDAGGPTFTAHFELRNTGPLPFTGGAVGRAEGWVRARNPARGLGDAVRVAAYVDAWWPALFSRWSSPRPIGTIAYALHVASSLEGLDPDAPLYHRARELATGDGYSAEVRELWGEDGRLVAVNTQTIAVIR